MLGSVQGVGFRWFVVRSAAHLGLTGWTANASDGSVHVVAEGSRAALDEFSALLERGPAAAAVDRVDGVRMPATGQFASFSVRSGFHRGD